MLLHDQLTQVTTAPEDVKVRIGHSDVTVTGAVCAQVLGRCNDRVERMECKRPHAEDLQAIQLTLQAEPGYRFCRHCWQIRPDDSEGCTNPSCIGNEAEFNDAEYALTPRPVKD